jgi:hypothetical protein
VKEDQIRQLNELERQYEDQQVLPEASRLQGTSGTSLPPPITAAGSARGSSVETP